MPALSGRLDAEIGRDSTLIIDVGGDDVGAYVLGRYAPAIQQVDYSMLYVVNYYRYLMTDPSESIALLCEIESASRLKATHIANCSNLGSETTLDAITASFPYVSRISQKTGLPIAFTVVPNMLLSELSNTDNMLPIEIYVNTPWNA